MNESILQELRDQALDPPADDERIAAFSQAVINLSTLPDGTDLLTAVTDRNLGTATYGARLLLLAVQKQLLHGDENFPLEFDDPERWEAAIVDIINTPVKAAELYHDIAIKHAQSNVVERYKAFKLAIELIHPILQAPPRILDIGCSRNHGLKKLHLNMPFQPIRSGVSGSDSRLSSRLIDRLVNNAIATPRQYGLSTGVDIVSLNSPQDAAWARNCSFYPSEFLDEPAVAEYDYLEAVEPETVQFKQADVLGIKTEDFEKYDVITTSTFLYQLSAEQRELAVQNLRGILSPKGVILYQDFTSRNRPGTQLVYQDDWFGNLFPYRTILEAPAVSPVHMFELFRWSNGRCKEFVPGRDLNELLNIIDIA